MLPGDDVYFVCDSAHLSRAMSAFGHEEEEGRNVIIAGGGNIGLTLAQEIQEDHVGVRARVIEFGEERAKSVAQQLSQTMVINGDVLDMEILEEASAENTETFVAVTNDDEVNIIGSLLAKRAGIKRTIALVNKHSYVQLINQLGIDAVVNPRMITVSSILQHVRRGRIRGIYSVREDFGEVIEAEALETSSLVGKSIRDAGLPNGVKIGAIIRADKVIAPKGDTVIEKNDTIVLFATYDVVKEVEKLFAVRSDFSDHDTNKIKETKMSRVSYVNGRYYPHKEVNVHVEDRGYQFADGVYEVILVKNRHLVDEIPHLDRLERSLQALEIAWPMKRQALKMVLEEVIDKNKFKDGIVYIQITRGVARRDHGFPKFSKPTLVITARPLKCLVRVQKMGEQRSLHCLTLDGNVVTSNQFLYCQMY